MTSSMTSQNDLKVVSLYSFMNEKITFFMITRFSIFLYEWWNDIFHDNWRKTKDIIFQLSAHMNHWIVNMRLQAILGCFSDDNYKSSAKIWAREAINKLDWLSEIQVSVSHTDQQILASKQSPIALSFIYQMFVSISVILMQLWNCFWNCKISQSWINVLRSEIMCTHNWNCIHCAASVAFLGPSCGLDIRDICDNVTQGQSTNFWVVAGTWNFFLPNSR